MIAREKMTMSVELAHYDAACRELALATRVDEVKDIRDKAVAMQMYAKLAKNKELMENAYRIKERAEIRIGEILIAMKESGERLIGRRTGGIANPTAATARRRTYKNYWRAKSYSKDKAFSLAELGVSYQQAFKWQRKARQANGQVQPKATPKQAQANKRRRERRAQQIGTENLKNEFTHECAVAEKVAERLQTVLKNYLKHGGSIDKDMLTYCRRASKAWIELTAKLEPDHG